MIRLSTCPYFSPQSFISLICLVDIGVYVIALAIGWEPGKFLTPTVNALVEMGAKDAYKMQVEMEMWRWFCPIVLHANLAHLLFNLFLQAIIGYRLEPSVGWVDTAIIYWASGCGGVLLSALCSPTTLGVGASASILGLVTGTVSPLLSLGI
jgi:membrane associated rhomboid family serine protease